MGCQASSNFEERKTKHSEQIKIESKVGVIEIKIKSIFLHKVMQGTETAAEQKVRFELSNQSEEYSLDKISIKPGEETVCRFYINSSSKQHGRVMTIEMWNKRKSSGKLCIGIFDLEPFLVPHNKR